MGLISLDRLIILKDRVLLTIKDYETLLKSFEKSFKNSNTQQVDSLQLMERELIKTLNQRVRIFKAYPINDEILKAEIDSLLNKLNNNIKNFKEQLLSDKIKLNREIDQVRKITKPLGRLREETAWRIDITT